MESEAINLYSIPLSAAYMIFKVMRLEIGFKLTLEGLFLLNKCSQGQTSAQLRTEAQLYMTQRHHLSVRGTM